VCYGHDLLDYDSVRTARPSTLLLPLLLLLLLPSGNKLCIVMEFAPAGDLSSFLKAAAASKLPLPEATVWQIFLQLCQGMQVTGEGGKGSAARTAYAPHAGRLST
jgi:serine/threonine protein kinase